MLFGLPVAASVRNVPLVVFTSLVSLAVPATLLTVLLVPLSLAAVTQVTVLLASLRIVGLLTASGFVTLLVGLLLA